MSRANHRWIVRSRPNFGWYLLAKNYINPEAEWEWRGDWKQFRTEEEAIRAAEERYIKYSQEVRVYSPFAQNGEFQVLDKKGKWKLVVPTKR